MLFPPGTSASLNMSVMCRPWHKWLLLAAGAEGFLALRSHLIPQPTSRRAAAAEDRGPARSGWGAAVGGGILLGLYLARELFPSQAALQACVFTRADTLLV